MELEKNNKANQSHVASADKTRTPQSQKPFPFAQQPKSDRANILGTEPIIEDKKKEDQGEDMRQFFSALNKNDN